MVRAVIRTFQDMVEECTGLNSLRKRSKKAQLRPRRERIWGNGSNGWVNYAHNLVLVRLFSHALVSSKEGHEMALEKIKDDIARLKKKEKLTK